MDLKETFPSDFLSKSSPPHHEHILLTSSRSASPRICMDLHQEITNTIAPPPVAMSLRTRESSSLSLKHIFDQISSGSLSRDHEPKLPQAQQFNGGFQGIRNQSMPDLRKRLPELDLSFQKARETSPSMFPTQTGFGSPISTMAPPANQSASSPANWLVGQMNSQLIQHSYLPQTAPSPRPNLSSRQSTAQMTIFYSGNVNVYDGVPADKAHAIMLLAGNAWSSNFRSPAPPLATLETKERDPSPVKATPTPPVSSPNINASLNISSAVTMARSFTSPSLAPSPTVSASQVGTPLTPPAPSPLADNIRPPQNGGAVRRSHAGIELPLARKASLARFLEKRKDRVEVQQVNPDQQACGEKGGGESASCSGKPDLDSSCPMPSSSKKQYVHSRTSSPTRSASNTNTAHNNASNNSGFMHEECGPHHQTTINEHRFL